MNIVDIDKSIQVRSAKYTDYASESYKNICHILDAGDTYDELKQVSHRTTNDYHVVYNETVQVIINCPSIIDTLFISRLKNKWTFYD